MTDARCRKKHSLPRRGPRHWIPGGSHGGLRFPQKQFLTHKPKRKLFIQRILASAVFAPKGRNKRFDGRFHELALTDKSFISIDLWCLLQDHCNILADLSGELIDEINNSDRFTAPPKSAAKLLQASLASFRLSLLTKYYTRQYQSTPNPDPFVRMKLQL